MTSYDSTLVFALDSLEDRLPVLLARYPEETDFWPAFMSEATDIRDLARDLGSGHDYVAQRIDSMLGAFGMAQRMPPEM
jgi:hypothetical protein